MAELRVYHSIGELNFSSLMQVYSEGNEENAGYFYPSMPIEESIKLAQRDFKNFLDKFFSISGNMCFVLEDGNEFLSALRLRPFDGFYYLEALETTPKHRRKGYAVELIKQVCSYLAGDDGKEVIIRDCVSKKNFASLCAHKKAGFVIETEQGIDYEDGSRPQNHYGMILKA